MVPSCVVVCFPALGKILRLLLFGLLVGVGSCWVFFSPPFCSAERATLMECCDGAITEPYNTCSSENVITSWEVGYLYGDVKYS
ncbi:hypothetical protein Alg130_00949 [Pyrenophora tritici-repentis]|uniref:Uncharacterized protein n=1 Tax=Pyrenophora tritici-repentis TaxID=45151 RepID=A0A834VJ49_9PLEO|nr:hypothetical protein A1F99_109930 [Pyrenophora tritici-repentis]KAF7564908.1 hypothetical protein PtrM4_043420 [Pyrenophora tritici-repentis]KAI0584346.1 hypothetical protein Alg215_03118 [Pyrenophora tritici-repentis]KAI0591808.1 hypothetical protein Alg130_00949 [Pyrenophora tritici-repentis]KAI0614993.1 hypothetical protein TUN205_00707 [Pyrenophora tritici-repentis]